MSDPNCSVNTESSRSDIRADGIGPDSSQDVDAEDVWASQNILAFGKYTWAYPIPCRVCRCSGAPVDVKPLLRKPFRRWWDQGVLQSVAFGILDEMHPDYRREPCEARD